MNRYATERRRKFRESGRNSPNLLRPLRANCCLVSIRGCYPRLISGGLSGCPLRDRTWNHPQNGASERGSCEESANGFNLIDEYTRECHCIHADRAVKASDVLELPQGAMERHRGTGIHPQRQRAGVHCQSDSALGAGSPDPDDLH